MECADGGAVASPAPTDSKKAAKLTNNRTACTEDHDKHVYLRTTWILQARRTPLWRLVTCTLRLALCFVGCASSPLLASRHTPGYFPIYSDLLSIVFTDVSVAKIFLHLSIFVIATVFIRMIIYRLWFEQRWNWQRQYRHARQSFTRLSSASRIQQPVVNEPASTIPLVIYSSPASEEPLHRMRIHTTPRAQGSWTLVLLLAPIIWLVVVSMLKPIVATTEWDSRFFGQATQLPQWRVQLLVFNVLMALHSLSWLLALDEAIQATLSHQTRVGRTLRLLFCWVTLVSLAVGVCYFDMFTQILSSTLAAWSQQATHSSPLLVTLSNESWRCMLSSVVVMLDIAWLLQDASFPCFATPVGTHVFGLPVDLFSLPVSRRTRIFWTSKWTQVAVVLGTLLPLDLCAFFQDLLYDPADYSQSVSTLHGYRVAPITNATTTTTSAEPVVIQQLMASGSIGRFLQQTLLDRAPSLMWLAMAIALALWMARRERWRLCYAAFLGRPTRAKTAHTIATVNAATPVSTRQLLRVQRRLQQLYHARSRLDLLGACLALTSVGAVVLQTRSVWIWEGRASSIGQQHTAGETFGLLLLLVSLAMGYVLYHRYAITHQILVLRHRLPPSSSSTAWWRCGAPPTLLLLPFITELLLSVACLPPFIHGDLLLDEQRYSMSRALLPDDAAAIITCPPRMVPTPGQLGHCQLQYKYPMEVANLAVFVRLYWLVRLLRNALFHRLFSDKATVLIAAGIGGTLPPEISSLRWSFRLCLALIPGRTVATIFLLLWVGTAAAVSILERPFPSLLDREEHSLWLTIVTISSVGYGDAYPVTAAGRLAVILGAVFGGAFVVSLVTSIFLETLKSSKHEHQYVLTLEKIAQDKERLHASAQLIATAWRYSRVKRHASTARQQDGEMKLFRLAHEYRVTRKRQGHAREASAASVEQQQLKAIAQWRTKHLTAWVQDTVGQRRQLVDSIEQAVETLEERVGPRSQ